MPEDKSLQDRMVDALKRAYVHLEATNNFVGRSSPAGQTLLNDLIFLVAEATGQDDKELREDLHAAGTKLKHGIR